jgi:hypothetical protein
MNNDSLIEILDRLTLALADYQQFVSGTRSMQLAIEKAREAK